MAENVAYRTGRAVTQRSLSGQRIHVAGLAFQGALLLCLLTCFLFIVMLAVQVFGDGWGTISDRGTGFLTSDLSRVPEIAGVAQGIFGSLMLAAIVVIIAFPLGIATAVYLEEYAPDNRITRIVDLNIRNLSGVPSVVYGLLGLAVFVKLLGTSISQETGGITGGRTLISGGLTLAILVLPIVIITSAESLRAVPNTLREGGYGVGAAKWEVVRSLVLPNALPGILTGTVLAISRALGETAPLILAGAFFGTFFTTGDAGFFEKFDTTYTALPMIVFQWASDSRTAFSREMAGAAIIVLMAITFLTNSIAVFLRHRYDKTW